MRINTNVSAINTSRIGKMNSDKRAGSIKKLSSGMKLNSAADDAAGVAISEKMRAQFRGLDAGSKNAQDAISFVQAADGAMQGMHDAMHRMRELGVQSANDTNEGMDREALQEELDNVKENIKESLEKMSFNGIYVFKKGGEGDSNGNESLFIQTGAEEGQGFDVEKPILDLELALDALNVETHTSAAEAVTKLDDMMAEVSTHRSKMGAYQNRLEFIIAKNENTAENVRSSESRIRDVDMAKETTEMVKNQIKGDTSTSMLAQVNSLPQNVLQLLG